MRISKKQLRRIIREAIDYSISDVISERQFAPYMPNRRRRPYHQVSPGTKSMANAAKRKFLKLYPTAKIKIDGRQGWILVNGNKAVNISSRDGRPGSIEDWVSKMEETFLKYQAPEDVRNRKPIEGPDGRIIQAKGLRR